MALICLAQGCLLIGIQVEWLCVHSLISATHGHFFILAHVPPVHGPVED